MKGLPAHATTSLSRTPTHGTAEINAAQNWAGGWSVFSYTTALNNCGFASPFQNAPTCSTAEAEATCRSSERCGPSVHVLAHAETITAGHKRKSAHTEQEDHKIVKSNNCRIITNDRFSHRHVASILLQVCFSFCQLSVRGFGTAVVQCGRCILFRVSQGAGDNKQQMSTRQ